MFLHTLSVRFLEAIWTLKIPTNEDKLTWELTLEIGEWRLNHSLVSSVLQVVQSVFRRDLTS